ncbi:hypothetical protein ATANTOWER_018483 [Ataeniobius toweri]|uniref:Uncharacterized protein n=1 Tax=Ataeniobius toweri TaxID=208326 RepID=A0ABU7AFX8_9TELE|nr:hypothetical protein [Ataeniobius toweri]
MQEMIMGSGFGCHANSLPVLIFFLWSQDDSLSFLQGQLGLSGWDPHTVIDQQRSGRDHLSVHSTLSYRQTAHGCTEAHTHTIKYCLEKPWIFFMYLLDDFY